MANNIEKDFHVEGNLVEGNFGKFEVMQIEYSIILFY